MPVSLNVPHDLAIQLIGSDAGLQKRVRPHGAMLRDASPEELALVAVALDPILDLEIKRVHRGERYTEREHQIEASPEAAVALKKFCVRYGANQREHLEKQPGNDRLHRTRQRLGQALDLIRQIDLALGLPQDSFLQSEAKAEAFCRLREALPSVKAFLSHVNPDDSQVAGMKNLLQSMEMVLAAGSA